MINAKDDFTASPNAPKVEKRFGVALNYSLTILS